MQTNWLYNIDIENLTNSERKIHSYVLSNVETMGNYDIKKLATETFSSISQINRYCNKIGCSGFKEFKYKCSELNYAHNSDELQINFLDVQIKEAEKEFIKLFNQAQHIIFICSGPSYSTNKHIKKLLENIYEDKHFFISQNKLETFGILRKKKNVLIIAISVKGTTEEVTEPALFGKMTGAKLITITGNKFSKLAQKSDLVFLTKHNDKLSNIYKLDLFPRHQELYITEKFLEILLEKA